MQIKVKKIRQLDIIEKELDSIASGVISLPLEEDFEQLATNFVYHNKNIYLFIQNKELYEDLKFGSAAKFTAIKDSSFDKMRIAEITGRVDISEKDYIDKTDERQLKVRQGKIGKGRDFITEEDLEYINEVIYNYN